MLLPNGSSGFMYLPDSKPAECPHCHKPEDIKQVCRSCGYEYPEENKKNDWKETLISVFVLLCIVFILFTLLNWLLPSPFDEHITLVQCFANSFKWLFNLFGRIF